MELKNEEFDFGEIYERKLKSHLDMKLVEFNFKFIRQILPCNDYLSRFTERSKLCTHCDAVENIMHMVFNCSHMRAFWNCIENALQVNINQVIILCWKKELSKADDVILEYIVYFVFLFKYNTNNNLTVHKTLAEYVKHKLEHIRAIYNHVLDSQCIVDTIEDYINVLE